MIYYFYYTFYKNMPYLLIALALVVIFVFGFYNKLKTLQVHIRASIQEIGNQLKRQADLIPNLVEAVKGYMTHEKDIFKMLTDARTSITKLTESGDISQLDQAQKLIDKALSALKVIVESNPQIQASGMVTNLMNELRDTADKVMYARRTLIDLTADYNTSISTIPGVWIAPILGFQPEKGLDTPMEGQHLSVSASDVQTPKVDLN